MPDVLLKEISLVKKLILARNLKSLINFLAVNLCLKGFTCSFEARNITLFEESSTRIPGIIIVVQLSKGLGQV